MIPGIKDDREVYLNGEFLPLSEAKISVLDRGFIFGDGVYEVVPAYAGKPFRIKEHVARLVRSLDKIHLHTENSAKDWIKLFESVIERSPFRDSFIYLQVTRGACKREHGFPKEEVQPTIFAMASHFIRPSPDQRRDGLRVVTMNDARWAHCDIKSVSLLGNILAKEYAHQHEVDEAVQFRNNCLTEGASSNIWVVKDGKLMAPIKNEFILEGIRYALLEEFAKKLDIPFEARDISKEEVLAADELLLTSATKEVLPITEIDGQPVGTGKPGAVFALLRQAYDEAVADL